MKSVLVDFRISEKSENTLLNMGYSVIRTTKSHDLAEPVCGHPDMLVCKLKNHDFIGDPTFRGILNTVRDLNYIDGKSELKKEYPFDIAYNCALVGNHLFCNEKYTDPVILAYCKNSGIKIIDTKQGYAKCSICIVSDNAIITADKNIYNTAIKNGIDTLFTENSGILLDGYNEGFFGGATGLIEKDLICVNGNIDLHKDCKRIKAFCLKYGVKVVSLSDDQLYDIGTVIRV